MELVNLTFEKALIIGECGASKRVLFEGGVYCNLIHGPTEHSGDDFGCLISRNMVIN